MLPEAFPHIDTVHSATRNDYEHEPRIFSGNPAGPTTQSFYGYEPHAPHGYHDNSRRESVASVDWRYPTEIYSPSTTASYHGSRAASPIARNLSQNSYLSQEHDQTLASSRRRKRHQSVIHERKGPEKRAQDKRHKTSEKQRRDYQGVYIDCGDKIRDIIHARTRDACAHCPGLDKKPKLANSKKAKKIKLEESTMFDFRRALHMSPDAVHEIMKEIASLAQSLSTEKEIGLMTDPNNQSKWSEDVRGHVAKELLTLMRQDCLRHGIEPLGDDFESASHYSDTSMMATGSPSSSVSGRSSRL